MINHDDKHDLEIVSRYLSQKGLTTERFSKTDTRAGKTPDFRVLKNGYLVAFCEVKSLHPPGVGGRINDYRANRLSGDIISARKQLEEVNRDRKFINFLAIVNYDNKTYGGDLYTTITGFRELSVGNSIPTTLHIATGRLAPAVDLIGAFLWFQTPNSPVPKIYLNDLDEQRLSDTCNLFGVE